MDGVLLPSDVEPVWFAVHPWVFCGFRVADCHFGHRFGGRCVPPAAFVGGFALFVLLVGRLCGVLPVLFLCHIMLCGLSLPVGLRVVGLAALFPLCPLPIRVRSLRGEASCQGALSTLRGMERIAGFFYFIVSILCNNTMPIFSTIPVTSALPIRKARLESEAPSVCWSGNIFKRSNSTGVSRL